jgi:hypothetical protein
VTDKAPGRNWVVVKVRPDGSEATRYDAREMPAPDGWLAVAAQWVHGFVDIGCFAFQQDDLLVEYFSLDRPYNAFATYRAHGEFVAWYCNVTHPTSVTESEITWHDLYVDVVVLASGEVLVLDEDELEQSGLRHRDPELHARILDARDELLTLIQNLDYPFSEVVLTELESGSWPIAERWQ